MVVNTFYKGFEKREYKVGIVVNGKMIDDFDGLCIFGRSNC